MPDRVSTVEQDPDGATLARLVQRVGSTTGFDLTGYRSQGLHRRAVHRARELGADLQDYADRVDDDADEARHLLDHLLVQYSEWFRDHRVWQVLREVVLPGLAVLGGGRVRVWVAGGGRGQEVWSLAACLAEAQHDGRLETWSVLATDVDRTALGVLERAAYPPARLPGSLAEVLRPHVRHDGAAWQVQPSLRDGVRCRRHDVRDAPPGELDGPVELVLCRNLLMYLDDDVQLTVLDGLLAAVRPGGAVVLGMAELPLGRREALVPVDLGARVFRSLAVPLGPERG